MARKSLFIKAILGVTSGITVLVAATILFFTFIDFKTAVEILATHHFGRTVKIGALRTTFRQALELELDDVHLANAPWGNDPDMLRFARARVTVDLRSLLYGPLRFRNFILEDVNLILERNEKGLGNWKLSGDNAAALASHPDHPSDAARDRRDMPTILNLILRDGHITFRTSSGKVLRIDLDNVALNTLNNNSPVTISVDGAYNDHSLQLAIATDSFDALHNSNKSFSADITVKGGDGLIRLNAQLMDPINFDDFYGWLDINTKNLRSMATVFSDDFQSNLPAQLGGYLERHNDDWQLTKAEGKVGDNPFLGEILLVEGPRHSPDTVRGTVNFDHLDIDALRTKMNVSKSTDYDVLYASSDPDPLVDANLGAKRLNYGLLKANDFTTHIRIGKRSKSIDKILFGWLGARVAGSIESSSSTEGNKVIVSAKATNINAQSLLGLAGTGISLTGKMDAQIFLSGYGKNYDDFKQHSNGEAVLVVKDGFIQTNALRGAALDVHALFGRNSDMTSLSCFLAASTVRDGYLLITPIFVRTTSNNLFGGGHFDLHNNNLDFNFEAEKAGALALRLPIHASGNINTMHIGLGSSADIERLKAIAPQNIDRLSSPFKMQAIKSGCL